MPWPPNRERGRLNTSYIFITERGTFNTSQPIHHIREREREIFKTS